MENREISLNPYIGISGKLRYVILIYYVLIHVIKPVIDLVNDSYPQFQLSFFITKLILGALIFFPFIFFRKNEFGWLHPLILPLIITLLKGLIKNPFHFLSVFSSSSHPLTHSALTDLTVYELAQVHLKADWIEIVALSVYYIGYFAFGVPKVRGIFHIKKNSNQFGLMVIALIGIFFSVLIFIKQEGISNHLLSLGLGRFRMKSDLGGGQYIVLFNLLTISVYAWYLTNSKAFRNPAFVILMLSSVALSFIITGSRGGIFKQMIILSLIWSIHHKKLPILQGILIGVLAFLTIGALGVIRDSGLRGKEVAWGALTETTLTEKVELTKTAIEERSDGYIAVVGKGHSKVGALWGRTYLSALMFFVPRAIWPNKPRSAGAYNGNMIYGNATLQTHPYGGDGNGVPPGGIGEAYWNFHLIGVIIIYFLYGRFHRWLAVFYAVNNENKYITLLYLLSLVILTPYSRTLVNFLQHFVLVTMVFWAIGYIKIGRIFSHAKYTIKFS